MVVNMKNNAYKKAFSKIKPSEKCIEKIMNIKLRFPSKKE